MPAAEEEATAALTSSSGLLASRAPDATRKADFACAPWREWGIDNTPQLSEHATNTDSKDMACSTGMHHHEGGWAKDVDLADTEQRARYRRRVEKDDAYLAAVASLAATLRTPLRTNTAVDIYSSFAFEKEAGAAAMRSPAFCARISAVLPSLLEDVAGGVAALTWHAADSQRSSHLAVTYMLSGPTRANYGAVGAIADVHRPGAVHLALLGDAALTAIGFSPREAHSIAAGSAAGAVSLYDVRRGGEPVGVSNTSSIRNCGIVHHPPLPVRQLEWLTGTGRHGQIATADGSNVVLMWDVRKLDAPVDRINAVLPGRDAARFSVSAMDAVPSSAASSKLLLGTSSGHVLVANCTGRSSSERVTGVYGSVPGFVGSVRRHPHLSTVFAMTSGAAAYVFSESSPQPLVRIDSSDASNCVSVAWHPVLSSHIVLLQSSGAFSVWGLGSRGIEGIGSLHATCVLEESALRGVTGESAANMVLAPDGSSAAIGTTGSRTVVVDFEFPDVHNATAAVRAETGRACAAVVSQWCERARSFPAASAPLCAEPFDVKVRDAAAALRSQGSRFRLDSEELTVDEAPDEAPLESQRPSLGQYSGLHNVDAAMCITLPTLQQLRDASHAFLSQDSQDALCGA